MYYFHNIIQFIKHMSNLSLRKQLIIRCNFLSRIDFQLLSKAFT